jgi:hypothetical protein
MRAIIVSVAFALVSAWISPAGWAAERFLNGDFEAGAVGFTSDYSFNGVSNTGEGQFAVVGSPFAVHSSWADFGDHTTGTGLMMTVNAATTDGRALWRQTVNVAPGQDYTFSAWAASSYFLNPALLSFRANDVEFLTLQLPTSVGDWIQATTVINSGANEAIEFEIVDLVTEPGGNDVVLDDISLDGPVPTAIPEPHSLLLWVLGVFRCVLAVRRREN